MGDLEMECVSKKKKKKSKEWFVQATADGIRIPQQERGSGGMTEDKEHF